MAIGYRTPEEGQADRGGNHTVWLLLGDGKWYSPKDISGLPPYPSDSGACYGAGGQIR